MGRQIELDVQTGDALFFESEVLVLKHAQKHYGVDKAAYERLVAGGVDEEKLRPLPGGFRYIPGAPGLVPENILLIGVVSLYEFQYREIREFARRSLTALAGQAPETRTVTATLHGAGYGLDESEAFESEMAGFLEAIKSGDIPRNLQKITVVERNPGRASRLKDLAAELFPSGTFTEPSSTEAKTSQEAEENAQRTVRLREAGHSSEDKPHIFIAMPFDSAMDDTYHYGIEKPVKAEGYLCERADLSSFTGDVMDWVRERIQTASFVIADLTDANPNVYLEVGYAWGCKVPTVLIAASADHLQFDVQSQRCLIYGSIRDLEEQLEAELSKLKSSVD